MAVCVGAMMVGTIKTTVKEGDMVTKGQEFGYFAFGKLMSFNSDFWTGPHHNLRRIDDCNAL